MPVLPGCVSLSLPYGALVICISRGLISRRPSKSVGIMMHAGLLLCDNLYWWYPCRHPVGLVVLLE